MGYIIEYEVCALLFIIVVMIRYFSMRKFGTKANRMFGLIMCCAVLNISFDIFSSYIIDNIGLFAPWAVYTVNTTFYMMQVAFPALMLFYVLVLSGIEFSKKWFLALMPAAIDEILLLTNPITGIMFYIEQTAAGPDYVRGIYFPEMYITSAFYMIMGVITVFTLRRYFRRTEVFTVFSFIGVIVAAMLIQAVFPRYLLTGVAISIAVFMMFLIIQNPETMLDSITGTFNYSALVDFLRKHITDKKAIWIAAVDVGGIRRINSMMGIRIGNELLGRVGAFINSKCGNHANAFRMIGTRFIIISENAEVHNRIVNEISARFKKSWQFANSETILMATIRYCVDKNEFVSPEDVINLIDLAYSRTAEEGFGTTKEIEFGLLEQQRRKSEINDALRRALNADEGFYLNYQPIYSVREKRFLGAEALLRFKDEKLGQVSPAEFIPVAESTGLIYQIDRLVVRKSCEFLRAHPELVSNGFRMLDINLSAMEFNIDSDSLFETVAPLIESLENRICFEVTETAINTRREILADFMERMIARGVRFAIDDFGTGYANITQISKLPFSVVKLDRIFVSQNNKKEDMLLADLVSMFDHIGLTTIFEGIETEEQSEFASGIGVDRIQGYFYSYPLSEEDFLALINAGTKQEENKTV